MDGDAVAIQQASERYACSACLRAGFGPAGVAAWVPDTPAGVVDWEAGMAMIARCSRFSSAEELAALLRGELAARLADAYGLIGT
jgi:hypothetical protein